VSVGVRQQRQKSCTLHSRSQLPLVLSFSTRNATGNNLASLGDVLLQSLEIFVIDLFDAFGSELTKLTSTEKNETCLTPRCCLNLMSLRHLPERLRYLFLLPGALTQPPVAPDSVICAHDLLSLPS